MLKNLAIAFIEIYQYGLRYFLPASCRFQPTCSEYTKEALERYGFLRGLIKGFLRISCCHPLSRKSGYAPLI